MMYSAGPGVGIAKVGTAAEVVWIPNLVGIGIQVGQELME